MPLIWCSISGHGFGHAAQVVPVLNDLGRLIPNLHVVLRTSVPDWFFHKRLNVSWELSRHRQDIGCIQHGPLHIDVEETWQAHAEFHENWEARVADEVAAIGSTSPRLVLSDIAYLSIEAGARAGLPTIGLSSLSWDAILERMSQPLHSDQVHLVQQIKHSYHYADLMMCVAPAIEMPVFRRTVNIAPIASHPPSDPVTLRHALEVSSDERIVGISFGGISLTSLPWECIEQMSGYRFIFSGSVPSSSRRVVSAETVPMTVPAIMASSDIVLTKPGYGTIVEAVSTGRRVIYVRRHNFADEDTLIDYLHRFGCAAELSADDFLSGRWVDAFHAVLKRSSSPTTAPLATGAEEAAHLLAAYF